MAEDSAPAKSEASGGMAHWKWLFQILVIPATTLIIGQYASTWQERESTRRTYADMISRRETSESDLRKDMFQTTILPFLDKKSDNVDASVLRMELLASNFHDALDLSPLFKDVYRTLKPRHDPASEQLMKRVSNAAQEVIRKQIDAVGEAGTVTTENVKVADLKEGSVVLFGDQILKLPGDDEPSRTFVLEIVGYDPAVKEFEARLTVWREGKERVQEMKTKFFHIGPFDFPLIDNTRLAGGSRVALTLDGEDSDAAQLTLVYFPGSRASLKDKQYYEDTAAELLRISKTK